MKMRSMGVRRVVRCLLVVLLVALLATVYASRRNLFGRYIEHRKQQEQVEAVRRQSEDLRKEIDSSRRRVENLGNDPLEIEAAIRRSKGLVREGEKIYRIEVGSGETTQGDAGKSGNAAP